MRVALQHDTAFTIFSSWQPPLSLFHTAMQDRVLAVKSCHSTSAIAWMCAVPFGHYSSFILVMVPFLCDWGRPQRFVDAGAQATKSAIGRLRPDFLDRCKPAAFLSNNYIFHLDIGSETDSNCTETDKSLLDDGRSSFPSGEACIGSLPMTARLTSCHKHSQVACQWRHARESVQCGTPLCVQ